jgi:predicted DNA-binding transcriptional regulator AlpA
MEKKSRRPLPRVISELLPDLDRVVSERLAAEILGLSRDTLRRKFQQGLAPPRVRLSEHRIGYRLSEIYKHLEKNTEQSGGLGVRHHHGPPSPSLA